MDFAILGEIFDKLNETSTIHFYQILFGDWILTLFGSESTEIIAKPITPITIALSSTNFISLVAVGFVLAGGGIEAFFSGFATTNVASGINSQIVAFRVGLFAILFLPYSMPSTGTTSTDKNWVYVTNAQANMLRMAITGGATADWIWSSVSPYLIKFDFGGSSVLQNNLLQTKDYAQAMLCNEVYYNYQKKQSSDASTVKRFTVTQQPVKNDYESQQIFFSDGTQFRIKKFAVNNLSEINYREMQPYVNQRFDISLGGKNETCGSFSINVPKLDQTPLNEKSRMSAVMSKVANKIMMNATDEAFQFASDLEKTAINAYAIVGNMSYENLVAIGMDTDFQVTPNLMPNLSGVAYSKANINKGINAIADNLIYTTFRTAYVRKELGCASFGQIVKNGCSSNLYPPTASTTPLGHKMLESMMTKYVLIGTFWRTMNELSDLMPLGANYLQNNNVKLYQPKEKDFCPSSSWWSFSFDEKDELYDCDRQAIAANGLEVIYDVVVKKLNASEFPTAIVVGNATIDPRKDLGTWRLYANTAKKESSSGLGDFNHNWAARMFISLFENVWWVGEDNATMVSSASSTEYINPVTLFSGEGIVNDITGNRSPYTFLAQFSSGLQDIYIAINTASAIVEALINASSMTSRQLTETMMIKSWGGLSWAAFALNVLSALGMSAMNFLLTIVGIIGKLMLMGSIIISYVMPMIPLVGWIFIILGVLFITVCAVGAIAFSLILLVVPKGDSMLPHDFSRIISLIYGVFIRQPMLVVGFVVASGMAYVGFSIVNFLFFPASLVNQDAVGILDGALMFMFVLIAYPTVLFFTSIYCYGRTSAFVEVIGNWVSPAISGGVFGADSGEEKQSVAMLQNIGGQISSISDALGINVNNGSGGSGGGRSRNRNRGA
ncbi:hypothetical protein [Photobacterium leiognathi]|uniref:hypothetical protein n=1 Tax=Photobacterium leiognathi TaxID=553611 RepID=UPI0029813D70|nr:hypothetical protein [Photobacterium leiognathi]